MVMLMVADMTLCLYDCIMIVILGCHLNLSSSSCSLHGRVRGSFLFFIFTKLLSVCFTVQRVNSALFCYTSTQDCYN